MVGEEWTTLERKIMRADQPARLAFSEETGDSAHFLDGACVEVGGGGYSAC